MTDPRVLSVYELALGLRRTVEETTGGLWVHGEAGRIQRPTSGHLYFTLKDEERDATLDCVMYRREAMRFGKVLTEGARVVLRGRATFYPPRGKLQWVADVARPAGRGALLEALEKLREKLAAEGLFDPAKKRPLPRDPRVVGVVTSRSGAAFADIRKVAGRRGRVRLVLSAATVQGDGAVDSILRALDRIERLPELEVLVLGRGGGSQEDLLAFNDERVVRRVAAFRVPVVSAVGHEIDVSLCDLVADARAATPSEAAELVVPDDVSRRLHLGQLERHLARAFRSVVEGASLKLARIERRLGDPRFLLAERQQELDELLDRLVTHQRFAFVKARRKSADLGRRLSLRHPQVVLGASRAELSPLEARLGAALRRRLDASRSSLAEQARALGALSPLSILGRGYALAFDEEGRAVRDALALRPGDPVRVRVMRGEFTARVEELVSTVENAGEFDQESPLGFRPEDPGT